jgi:hypothetical protein
LHEDIIVVDWAGEDDPENPYASQCCYGYIVLIYASFNWSRTYRWVITLTTCFMSALSHRLFAKADTDRSSILTGLPAGAYGAASEQMSSAWNIDETNFPYLAFALVSWNMGAAVFPLLFVPLTETIGRMPGYFVSALKRIIIYHHC